MESKQSYEATIRGLRKVVKEKEKEIKDMHESKAAEEVPMCNVCVYVYEKYA